MLFICPYLLRTIKECMLELEKRLLQFYSSCKQPTDCSLKVDHTLFSLTRYERIIVKKKKKGKKSKIVKWNDTAKNILPKQIKVEIYNSCIKPLCMIKESIICTRKFSVLHDFVEEEAGTR